MYVGKWACSACLTKGKIIASTPSTKQVLVIEDDTNDNKMDIVPITSVEEDTTMITVTTITSVSSVEVMPIVSAPRCVMNPNIVTGFIFYVLIENGV